VYLYYVFCLYVLLLAYLKNHMPKLHLICCACYLTMQKCVTLTYQ